MAENKEEEKQGKKFNILKFIPAKKIITIILLAVFIICIISAVTYELKVSTVTKINENNPNYSPSTYNKNVYITQDGKIMSGMSVEEMWEKNDVYSKYLPSIDALAYFLNAEVVTKYPYMESASADELNGTIRFFRNDNSEPMKYVDYSTLNSYVSSYNGGDLEALDNALSSFTLNADGTIGIAYLTENIYEFSSYDSNAAEVAKEQIGSLTKSDTYNIQKKESFLSITNISYNSYVEKYTLPFELLWSFIVFHGEQGENFAHALASMAYESEINLRINDNKTTTIDTYTYTYDIEEQMKNTNASVYAVFNKHISSNTSSSTAEDSANTSVNVDRVLPISYQASTNHQYSSKPKVVNQYNSNNPTIYKQTNITNSQSLMVMNIKSWIATFDNDITLTTSEYSSDRTPDIAQPESPTEWILKETTTKSWSLNDCPMQGLQKWAINELQKKKNQEQSNKNISKVETGKATIKAKVEVYNRYNNIHETFNEKIIQNTYTINSITSPVFNTDLSRLLNVGVFSDLKESVTNSYKYSNGYFKRMIEGNEETANMVDLISYWFNNATGTTDFGKDLEWDSIWRSIESQFETVVSSTSSLIDLATQYVNANEGCTKESSDGTKYMIQDDGAGNLAVGHGIDIYNGGYESLFRSKGYEIKEGEYVDKQFVKELERQEIQEAYEAILKETASLNLKDYQIIALISRYYNAGPSGWKKVREGKTFVQAYKAYWSEEKIENYFGKKSDSTIYSEDLYTKYMYLPNSSKNVGFMQGLENRRKSEWLAFTTGYFDKIDIQWTEDIYASGDIVTNAKKIHDYIRQNNYAYACRENVKNGYTNSCTCNGISHFGLKLTASNYDKWYNIRCIDCSAYVSLVLYESGIDIGRKHSGFFYNGEYSSAYPQYNWQKITDWNNLQPGDILVKKGHVGIYIGNGYSLEAGSTSAIRKEKNYKGNVSSIIRDYAFAVRVSK